MQDLGDKQHFRTNHEGAKTSALIFSRIDWVTAFFKCQEHRGPDAYQRDRGLDFIKPDRPAGRRPECSDSSRAAETVG
jgi:hypothetical protein